MSATDRVGPEVLTLAESATVAGWVRVAFGEADEMFVARRFLCGAWPRDERV